jgi:hypothetical protein
VLPEEGRRGRGKQLECRPAGAAATARERARKRRRRSGGRRWCNAPLFGRRGPLCGPGTATGRARGVLPTRAPSVGARGAQGREERNGGRTAPGHLQAALPGFADLFDKPRDGPVPWHLLRCFPTATQLQQAGMTTSSAPPTSPEKQRRPDHHPGTLTTSDTRTQGQQPDGRLHPAERHCLAEQQTANSDSNQGQVPESLAGEAGGQPCGAGAASGGAGPGAQPERFGAFYRSTSPPFPPQQRATGLGQCGRWRPVATRPGHRGSLANWQTGRATGGGASA